MLHTHVHDTDSRALRACAHCVHCISYVTATHLKSFHSQSAYLQVQVRAHQNRARTSSKIASCVCVRHRCRRAAALMRKVRARTHTTSMVWARVRCLAHTRREIESKRSALCCCCCCAHSNGFLNIFGSFDLRRTVACVRACTENHVYTHAHTRDYTHNICTQ